MQVGMFLLFVRGIEVVETMCFVLRKKQNQVTFLHIYHHISVFLLLWLTIKISAGDMELFVMVLNLYVHVVMYVYYFLALFKPMQAILRPIKPAITIMQMVSKQKENYLNIRKLLIFFYICFSLLIDPIRADVWPCCYRT